MVAKSRDIPHQNDTTLMKVLSECENKKSKDKHELIDWLILGPVITCSFALLFDLKHIHSDLETEMIRRYDLLLSETQ